MFRVQIEKKNHFEYTVRVLAPKHEIEKKRYNNHHYRVRAGQSDKNVVWKSSRSGKIAISVHSATTNAGGHRSSKSKVRTSTQIKTHFYLHNNNNKINSKATVKREREKWNVLRAPTTKHRQMHKDKRQNLRTCAYRKMCKYPSIKWLKVINF